MKCEKTEVNNSFEWVDTRWRCPIKYPIVFENITAEETSDIFKAFAIYIFIYIYIYFKCIIDIKFGAFEKAWSKHFLTNSEAATGGVLWK